MKTTATIIPFPTTLAKAKRIDDGTRHGRRVSVRKGMIDIFVGDDGMTLIEACVPTALAARVLAELKGATAK